MRFTLKSPGNAGANAFAEVDREGLEIDQVKFEIYGHDEPVLRLRLWKSGYRAKIVEVKAADVRIVGDVPDELIELEKWHRTDEPSLKVEEHENPSPFGTEEP